MPDHAFFGFGDGSIALAAVESVFPPEGRNGTSASQQVILRWLGEQAGLTYPFSTPDLGIDAAVDRFALLRPEEQWAWLESNWDALRTGDLILEDLP